MSKQQISQRRGRIAWLLYDWADTAFASLIQTFVFAAYFTQALAPNAETGTRWWGFAIGGAGVVVALLAPVLGAAADRSGRLKPWLGSFALLCALATAGLSQMSPGEGMALCAMLLVALGTIGAQCAMIFYNAMLPHLIPAAKQGLWSGWGWGMGYFGGLLCLLAAWLLFLGDYPLVSLDKTTGAPVRAVCVLTAGWIICFTLPLMRFTPDRGGASVPLARAISEGLAQLCKSLREIRRYRNLWRFLLAHLFYRDALAALFAMGGVFAAGTFGLMPRELLMFGVMLSVTSGIGAIGFAWIDQRIGSHRTIVLALLGLMVSAALLLFAARSVELFWVFGGIMGLFCGPVQASSRALLGQLAPEALRTQMFGLYALSGRATAFVGPLLVGWVTALSGSQRIGMASLLVLFAVGFGVLLSVRGRTQ